jgi:propanol-preferring alcohol dehydrogenase
VGVITDAIATPVKVARKARVTPHDTVAVFGAGGGLGVHMLKVARWAHARKVIGVDVMASKFETCVKAGADATVDASDGRAAEQLLELTDGRGVDVAIDFVCANGTQEAALKALAKGGRYVMLAGSSKPFTADPAHFMRKEAEIMSSRYATRQEVLDSLELVARGDLWPLVTEKAPLEQAEAIHQRLDKGLVTGRAALLIG